MTVGKNFTSSSISPLKSTLKKELGIDNAQYANVHLSLISCAVKQVI